MALVLRYRKPRMLDVCLDFSRVDVGQADLAEPLADKELRSRDVIRRKRCVRCPGEDGHNATTFVTDILPIAVASTDPPYVTDFMAEEGNHEMEPVAGRNAALADMFAKHNLLPNQRDHDGVVHVVVDRVTVGNIFQGKAPNEANDVRIGWLEHPIDQEVLVL